MFSEDGKQHIMTNYTTYTVENIILTLKSEVLMGGAIIYDGGEEKFFLGSWWMM